MSHHEACAYINMLEKMAAGIRRGLIPGAIIEKGDLISAGMVGVLNGLSNLKDGKHKDAYIRIRARGAMMDEIRRFCSVSRRHRETFGGEIQVTSLAGIDVEDPRSPIRYFMLRYDDLEALNSCIKCLTDYQLEVIRRRFFLDVKQSEMAKEIGVTEGRMSQIISEATAKLKRKMESEDKRKAQKKWDQDVESQ